MPGTSILDWLAALGGHAQSQAQVMDFGGQASGPTGPVGPQFNPQGAEPFQGGGQNPSNALYQFLQAQGAGIGQNSLGTSELQPVPLNNLTPEQLKNLQERHFKPVENDPLETRGA
jgi:hypothetical protein